LGSSLGLYHEVANKPHGLEVIHPLVFINQVYFILTVAVFIKYIWNLTILMYDDDGEGDDENIIEYIVMFT
jgi:hypothetical protein